MDKIFKKAELIPVVYRILNEYDYDCLEYREGWGADIVFVVTCCGLGGYISGGVLCELMSVGCLLSITGYGSYLELVFVVKE